MLADYNLTGASERLGRPHLHAGDGSIVILDVDQRQFTVETLTVPNVDLIQFQVLRPEGLEVSLDSVRAKLDGLSLSGLTHRVVNSSGQALVAIRVQWSFYAAADKLITVARNSWDAWGGANAALPSGATLDQSRLEVAVTPQEQIRRVTATIVYAELADGSRFGIEANSDPFGQRRKNIRSTFEEILSTYRTGGEQAVRAQLRSCSQDSVRPGRSNACNEAVAILDGHGVPALIQHIEGIATMP